MSIVRIGSNATAAKLYDSTPEIDDLVNKTLSYMVDNAGFSNAFTSGDWAGRSSFFSYTHKTFPAGFVHIVHATLTKAGHKVQLIKKPAPPPLGPENPIVDEFGNDNPDYDYQLQTIRQVDKHLAGIVQIATGGGKSKVAKLLVARWRRPTLFLTTRSVLMRQMQEHYEAQGLNVGVIGDGELKVVRGVNVGMVQTLVARLKVDSQEKHMRDLCLKESGFTGTRKEMLAEADRRIEAQKTRRARTMKVLDIFEVVIGEEAHEAGGDSYFEILQACRNAHVRVALTATPFMRENEVDNMRLAAAFGPLLIKVSEQTLIERGILAKPIFKFATCRSPDKLKGSTPWARAYELGFTENEFLNGDVVADAVKAARLGLPVMTLIQRKKHGTALRDLMEAAGLRVEFILGENNQAERTRALKQLGSGAIDVLIGTNILDVGVDVPAVGLVQLAGGGKAEVAHRQRIGRGLRRKKKGPNVAFIADYSTGLNSYHRQHTAQRRAIVDGTPGFVENVLPPGADLPWELFDAARAEAA